MRFVKLVGFLLRTLRNTYDANKLMIFLYASMNFWFWFFFNTSSKDKHTNFYVKQIDSEESDTQKFNIFDNIFGKKKLTDEEINIISEAVLNKTNLQGAINSISNSQINSQNRKENDDCGGGRMLNNTIGVESNLYFLNNNSFYDNDNEENEKIGVSTTGINIQS